VEIEEGGVEENERGGSGAVNAEMFKLKLKMNRCCTFYNIAPPGWLTKSHEPPLIRIQIFLRTGNQSVFPSLLSVAEQTVSSHYTMLLKQLLTTCLNASLKT
jgi:hypothetical protein